MINHSATGKVTAITPRGPSQKPNDRSRQFHYEITLTDGSKAYILDPEQYEYISDKLHCPADGAFIEFVMIGDSVELEYVEWGKRKVVIKVVHDGMIYGSGF